MIKSANLARFMHDHPVSPLNWRPGTWVVLLLASYFAVAVASLEHFGVTYDEEDHLRYGVNILHGDADRFDDSKMPVSAWNALPGRLAGFLPEGALRDALASLSAARIPTILAALLLGFLVYRWARELYGDKAGLLALALFALDVNLLTHARLVTTDLYAALGTTLVLYSFWRFQRDGGLRRGIWAALALGFAQIAKYSGVFLVPLLALLAAVRHWRLLAGLTGDARGFPARLHLKATLGYAALFMAAVLLVINAGFLFRKTFTPLGGYEFRSELFQSVQQALPHALPVPVPYPYVEGLDWVRYRERIGGELGNPYFLGELRPEGGFKGYYFVAYLFKVPLSIQILFIAALIVYWHRRRSFDFSRDEAFLLLPVLFFFVYFNFLYNSQTGIRFLLVAFPMMHVFTASLFAPMAAPGKGLRRTAGVLLLAAAVSVLSWHPHYLSYFNELVPDRKQAYRILADSNLDWGGNDYWIGRWLQENPGAILNPGAPVSGRVVVEANLYTGVLAAEQFAWLRWLDKGPVDQVAYTYLVFEVTPRDLERLPDHLRGQEFE